MTKDEFLHWACKYRDTTKIRELVAWRKFSEEELDYIKRQMEPTAKLLASETEKQSRRWGA